MHVALMFALNDIDYFHGGSRSGIKAEISYLTQFLMLRESIRRSWLGAGFSFDFHILHSIDFDTQKTAMLTQMEDVTLTRAKYRGHPLKVRPACYTTPVDCDYKLILDVDMLAIGIPDFDFKKDVQAAYGGNKYNEKQWQEICKHLDCPMPQHAILQTDDGHYHNWNFQEPRLMHEGKLAQRLFPYFNNGAVLIKNEIAPTVGELWDQYRIAYSDFIQERQGINIDLEGQDVIGLAVNALSENWSCFAPGINLCINDNFEESRRLCPDAAETASLIHYINCTEGSEFYDVIWEYESIVRKYSSPH